MLTVKKSLMALLLVNAFSFSSAYACHNGTQQGQATECHCPCEKCKCKDCDCKDGGDCDCKDGTCPTRK